MFVEELADLDEGSGFFDSLDFLGIQVVLGVPSAFELVPVYPVLLHAPRRTVVHHFALVAGQEGLAVVNVLQHILVVLVLPQTAILVLALHLIILFFQIINIHLKFSIN